MSEFHDIWEQTNWFVVQTRAYREELAAASVAKQEVEVFFPRVRKRQAVCGVWRWLTRPMFPGYFFSRFCPTTSLEALRYSRGVLRVVGTRLFPIPVEAEVISGLRERAANREGLVPEELRQLQPGCGVRIEAGPFQGFLGRVERESDDGRRVVILLEALQQARLSIERRWVSAAQPA